MKATPKTLYEAIANGVEACFEGRITDSGIKIIEDHVRDLLAQKFTTATMSNQSLIDLWAKIIERPNHE
jgi:hypothetical protein